MDLGQGRAGDRAALQLAPATSIHSAQQCWNETERGFLFYYDKGEGVLLIPSNSKSSLLILSPSLLVERQAGFSPRCNLSPSTSCRSNEIEKWQSRATCASAEHLSSLKTQRPPPTTDSPKLYTLTPSQVRSITRKPKYFSFGFRQACVSAECLPCFSSTGSQGAPKLTKARGERKMSPDLRW